MPLAFHGRLRAVVLIATGAVILPLAFFASGITGRATAPQDDQARTETPAAGVEDAALSPTKEAVTDACAEDLAKAIAKRAREELDAESLSPESLNALERDVSLALIPIMLADFEQYHRFMTSAGLTLATTAEASVEEELELGDYTEEEVAHIRSMSLVDRVEYLWQRPEIRGAAWETVSTESLLAKEGFHNTPWPRWDVVGGRMSIYESPEGQWHRQRLARDGKEPVVTIRFAIRFTTSGTTSIDFQFIHLPVEGVEGGRWAPLGVYFAVPSGTWPRPLL